MSRQRSPASHRDAGLARIAQCTAGNRAAAPDRKCSRQKETESSAVFTPNTHPSYGRTPPFAPPGALRATCKGSSAWSQTLSASTQTGAAPPIFRRHERSGRRAWPSSGQSEPAIRQGFFDRWVSPRRAATISDLQRAKNAGELRSDTQPDVLNDAIFGAIYYRFLLGLGPFTRRFGDELVEQAIRGHRSGNAGLLQHVPRPTAVPT